MLEYSYFLAAAFLAGAFFATFFAGAFFAGAAFLAGAFLAGISYPPFHSAVAEDKKFTTRLTNEQSLNRQSEIDRSREFLRDEFEQNKGATEPICAFRVTRQERHRPAKPLQHSIYKLSNRANRCSRNR